MDLYAISTVSLDIDKAIDLMVQNWGMTILITLPVVSFGFALYLAIREKIKTGSWEGLRTVILMPIVVFAAIFALSYLAVQLSFGNPYARAVRNIFAVIMPGLFFSLLYASISNVFISIAYSDRRWKYLDHFGIFFIVLFTMGSIYIFLVFPVIDGLSPLFFWQGIFTGWMLAPVFISKGYVLYTYDQDKRQPQE